MNTHIYRNYARIHLKLFEKEFGSNDNDRLKMRQDGESIPDSQATSEVVETSAWAGT